jgi:hypothetical protein
LLSMESPAREDSPRVTRRRTTDGDNPPPLEFDKGWSSFRGKKSSAGLFSSLPLACVTPPTHPHIPTLGLSFAITIIAAPPVHQVTLPASSVETSTLGVLSISLPSRTTPRLHSLTPYTALSLHCHWQALLQGVVCHCPLRPPRSQGQVCYSPYALPTLPCRTALVHALPYLQPFSCFFLRLPDYSGACQ